MNSIDPMEHKGLVHQVLKTNTWLFGGKSSWTRDDAFQEGMIGLIEALQTYDSSQGTVATYCMPRIKWALFRAYRNQQGLIRKPLRLHELQSKLKKIQLEYIQHHNNEPDPEYLASQLQMTVPDLHDFLDLLSPELSLDAPITGTEDLTLADTIKDERDQFNDVEIHLQMTQLRKDLQRMMDEKLTTPDQSLLKQYYAWDGEHQPTLKDLAENNNFSMEITRGKIRRSLDKFKKFRPELVRNYPDIIMSQIYGQYQGRLSELKSMKSDMLQAYLQLGDIVQVNKSCGVIMGIDYLSNQVTISFPGGIFLIPIWAIDDFEMKEGRVTRIIIKMKRLKEARPELAEQIQQCTEKSTPAEDPSHLPGEELSKERERH